MNDGQHIGDVGSSGVGTGAHLHLEVPSGDTNSEAIDAAAWLNEHGSANLPTATSGSPAAFNISTAGTLTGIAGDPDQLVNDPTSSGKITGRMPHLYQQTLATFPHTVWGCYSLRPRHQVHASPRAGVRHSLRQPHRPALWARHSSTPAGSSPTG